MLLELSDSKVDFIVKDFTFSDFYNQYVDSKPYEYKEESKFLKLQKEIDNNDLSIYEDDIIDILSEALFETQHAVVGVMSLRGLLKRHVQFKRDILGHGKFFKRLKRFLHSYDSCIVTHDILQSKPSWDIKESDYIKFNLPESYIQKINAVIQEHNKKSEFHTLMDIFDFSKEDYRPGKYQEERSSCFWSTYNDGRLHFLNNGGFSLRHYKYKNENKTPYGRTWGYIDYIKGCESLIIFNLYDDSIRGLFNYANLLKDTLESNFNIELFSKEINLNSPYLNNQILWINGESGVIISLKKNEDILNNVKSLDMIDSNIFDNFDSDFYCRCDHCNDPLSEDEYYYSEYMDQSLCEYCYNDCHGSCDHCGSHLHEDELNEVENNNHVCQSCLESYYVQCSECSEYTDIDYSFYYELEDDYYCSYCHDHNFKECKECKESFNSDDLIKVEISINVFDYYCQSCIKDDDNINQCFKCSEFKDDFQLTKINKNYYCTKCELSLNNGDNK